MPWTREDVEDGKIKRMDGGAGTGGVFKAQDAQQEKEMNSSGHENEDSEVDEYLPRFVDAV